MQQEFSSIELCAGAGGQALGLHQAGFRHKLMIEVDAHACQTLHLNNAAHHLGWEGITCCCLKDFAQTRLNPAYHGIDLVAGGVPCPPFSKAGKQLGAADERDLFPAALAVIRQASPKAVMLENVSGLLEAKFSGYRTWITTSLEQLGYVVQWRLINASEHGVPQLRPRVVLVALQPAYAPYFNWPEPTAQPATVGETLLDLMAENGWEGAQDWALKANTIAPTLVGGSKKHGGPDLGPTRAKAAWQALGVNGHRIADSAPTKDFQGEKSGYENMPLLTVRMAARLQGFPDWWQFSGRKTAAYRQIGNAFPPPVAQAVGSAIRQALQHACAAVRAAA
jgi:DNA (cytosine-5)-methyltransferase 1